MMMMIETGFFLLEGLESAEKRLGKMFLMVYGVTDLLSYAVTLLMSTFQNIGRERGEHKDTYPGCGGYFFDIPRSGNVKEKVSSIDDGPDVGNGGSCFVTSNVGDSPSPPEYMGKFGLVKSMMIKDMHFLKFGSKQGIEAMLEIGPWLIHNVPLILKQWTPNANIMKEDVCNILVWVKFYDAPITAFTEDGASYARAMIKFKANVVLRDTIVVVVPKFSGEGFTTNTIHVEYEWISPRCLECKDFGHFLPKAAKANGNPKVQMANKDPTRTLSSFDALSTLVDEEEHEKLLEMKIMNKASTSNPSTSMGDQLVESDEDEVEFPNDKISRYMSSISEGGFCEDDHEFYDR
ncbi:zinc knuckle CX2CX4HX4C containing protein [Tanacetum coccineum]